MKKNVFTKKLNLLSAVCVALFLMLFIAPSTSTLGSSPEEAVRVYLLDDPGVQTSTAYFTQNKWGTFAIGAYFEAGKLDGYETGRHSLRAVVEYMVGSQTVALEYSANLTVRKDGSGIIVGTITGS